MRYLFQVDDVEKLDEWFSNVQIECYDMDLGDQWRFDPEIEKAGVIVLEEKTQIEGLLEAIRKDSESGYIAQQYQFHDNESYVFCISFECMPEKEVENEVVFPYWYNCNLAVYGSSIHTINYLKQLKVE